MASSYNHSIMMSHSILLSLEDVRCFQGVQQGQLRPITLLVGENSTGKTTFLGCLSAVHRLLQTPLYIRPEPDFNEDPFLMGSFREIVRARRGPSGKIREFKIGLGFSLAQGVDSMVTLGFGARHSQPSINSICWTFGNESFRVHEVEAGKTLISNGSLEYEFDAAIADAMQRLGEGHIRGEEADARWAPVVDSFGDFIERWSGKEARGRRLAWYWGLPFPGRESLASVAPLRAKPQRTYNPVRETSSPEGANVPMYMMRLARSQKGKWKQLHDDLMAFGGESGLFSDVKVRGPQGQHMSDPFQLQFKARSGTHANIVDVGYGVSQSLPILVEISSVKNQTFILQQPEVHLHPRGQAELASFFVKSAKARGNRFLIETHSDYIIDRVRIDVRAGKLAADDVSILYFEPLGSSVSIHNLALDTHGNLRGAPPGYREFFAKETDRLLGFED